jgi:hypothetical protein
VDYVTALNERLRKDITPESNANVLIWRVLGPHPEGGTMPPEYFKWLGIESPPESGEYLLSWRNYANHINKNDDVPEGLARPIPMLEVPTKPWRAEEHPELADWLARNEQPLALAIEATRRPEYYNPLVPKRTEDWSAGLLEALLPNVQCCREIAAAFASRALLRVAEGKIDEAWQDLLACHRFGRLIVRGGTLVEMLVGLALDQVASKADVAFLEHAKLTSKQVLQCLEDVRHLPDMPAVADTMNLGERFMLLDIITLTIRQGPESLQELSKDNSMSSHGQSVKIRLFTRSINWDPAFENANRWVDRYVAAMRIANRSERAQELTTLNQELKVLKRQVSSTGIVARTFMGSESRGEVIGNILISLLLPAVDKLQYAAERCEQGQRNLHLAFALAAYKSDHGNYPANLGELAPKYLERIPDDLFAGKPLIYRLEDDGYLLYSVGVNGRDEDGRSYGDEPPGDDIVVRIPIPDPPQKN